MFVVEQSCPYQEVDDSDKVSCICGWITDSIGIPIQHLQYLPYGEPYVNQHPFGYSERFRSTGKEKDEEKEMSGGCFASERGEEPRSGIQYCSSLSFTNFGARYMDHELMTMWQSVNPMPTNCPPPSSTPKNVSCHSKKHSYLYILSAHVREPS